MVIKALRISFNRLRDFDFMKFIAENARSHAAVENGKIKQREMKNALNKAV